MNTKAVGQAVTAELEQKRILKCNGTQTHCKEAGFIIALMLDLWQFSLRSSQKAILLLAVRVLPPAKVMFF